MTDTKTPARTTVKAKKARHASAQASYMERKRAEGKEWLATWVPGDAKEAFKVLAKQAGEDSNAPDSSYIQTVEAAVGEKAPDWAVKSQTLLNIWMISGRNVEVDLTPAESSHEDNDDKKDKKKKKKKKK